MHSPLDTIAAIVTPIGESGIGVIRVSGPKAFCLIDPLFLTRHGKPLSQAASHTCQVGTFTTDEPIDQVIATLFRCPNSYTGDDVVELSAHGNPLILNRILQALVKYGARLADPGEFTERAFLAGKMDLTQAEAVADLIRAKTDQAHAAALGQLEGHLAAKVRTLRAGLLPLLAHVEVGLDHSDEDHEFLSREGLIAKCRETQSEIETLLASARVGKILREGVRVALVGRPNVGKSSLLNALLKEERAIVTPIPGTTRDTLEESVNWEGIPVVLTDTAGVRDDSQDPVERLGMERTRKALRDADLVLCVFDGSEPMTAEDYTILRECEGKPHLFVMNKVDLTPTPSPTRRGEKAHRMHNPLPVGEGTATLVAGGEAIEVSAKTGQGLDELVREVKRISLDNSDTGSHARWMLNARHQAALERAREALAQAAQAAEKNAYEECVALELNTALGALGEVIGETATEDLLDQIFSKFCIGK